MSADKPLVPQGPQLLAPVPARLVAVTLALAFMLTLLPWPDEVAWLVPDFTLVALLYWSIVAPRLAGLGVAFGLGLIGDATHGLWMGQYALSYVLSVYIALSLQRRLENFPLFGRALHLAPILFGQSLLVLLTGVWFGARETDWNFLAGGVLAALIWLPVAILLDRLGGRPGTLLADSPHEIK